MTQRRRGHTLAHTLNLVRYDTVQVPNLDLQLYYLTYLLYSHHEPESFLACSFPSCVVRTFVLFSRVVSIRERDLKEKNVPLRLRSDVESECIAKNPIRRTKIILNIFDLSLSSKKNYPNREKSKNSSMIFFSPHDHRSHIIHRFLEKITKNYKKVKNLCV